MAMAVRARTFLSKPFLAPRSFSSTPSSSYSSSLIRRRPLAAALSELGLLPAVPAAGVFRGFSTRPTTSSLNDPSPNWSNRPPKETILLDGCDFEHWLIVMEPPEGEPTRDDIIDSYIKTLAEVVGSEEEARMKIYSVSTKHYFAFGALVSEELSIKIKTLPRVRWVLPDSYLDVKNKDYGGEPFINGQAVPYDPKYHEEWVRNNARANERSRRNDRPRNYDRSRNFERRRENMQNRDFQNTAPPSPPRMTAAPGTGGPGGVGMPNAGYPNQGVPPPSTGMPNSGFQNHGTSGPNYQNPGSGGLPNSGYPNQQGMGGVPNPGFQNPNHPGMGGVGNAGFQNPGSAYQNRGMEGPANPGFQKGMGGVPNPGFQNPNHPGIGGVGNSGLQNPGSAYQNRGMDGLANGPHQNQAAGGYPNQGSGFQNQGSYQNQGNFPNQGNYPSPGNYQNQGTGGVPNSGYPNTYVPNRDVSGMPNPNAYQGKDVPGRDAPTMPNRDY